MPESDARDPEPDAPATPRVSGELSPGLALSPTSSTRVAEQSEEQAAVSEPGDTLLSAGKPAPPWELLLEDRLGALEQQLGELSSRLSALERKRPREALEPRHKPWLWIAFLIAIVVVFQLLRRMR